MAEKPKKYIPSGMTEDTYDKLEGLPSKEKSVAYGKFYASRDQYYAQQRMRSRSKRRSGWDRLSQDLNKGFSMTFEALVPGYSEIVKAQKQSEKATQEAQFTAQVTQPTAALVEDLRAEQAKEMERYEKKRTASQQEKQATSRRRAARYGRRSLLSAGRLGQPLDTSEKQRTLG